MVWLTSKNKNKGYCKKVFIGIGILFIGMGMMSSGLKPLAQIPAFTQILAGLNNPIIGIIVGVIMTTVIQSSSAFNWFSYK